MIVPVKTDTWNYDIVLEPGAIKKAGELLNLNRRVLVVTDSGVPAQYAETVAAQCGEAAIVTIPQGESRASALTDSGTFCPRCSISRLQEATALLPSAAAS